MDISIILMIIGIICIIISFFLKDKTNIVEKELEDLSINIFQETNSLKRRIKLVEEELLVDHNFNVKPAGSPSKVSPMTTENTKPLQATPKNDPMETFKQVAAQVKAQQAASNYDASSSGGYIPPQAPPQATEKPIHSILVSQVLELNKQGLSLEEICKLSTLSIDQVRSIIATNGGSVK